MGTHLKHLPDDETYWFSISAQFKPLYLNTQLVNTRRCPALDIVRGKVKSLVELPLSYELEALAAVIPEAMVFNKKRLVQRRRRHVYLI